MNLLFVYVCASLVCSQIPNGMPSSLDGLVGEYRAVMLLRDVRDVAVASYYFMRSSNDSFLYLPMPRNSGLSWKEVGDSAVQGELFSQELELGQQVLPFGEWGSPGYLREEARRERYMQAGSVDQPASKMCLNLPLLSPHTPFPHSIDGQPANQVPFASMTHQQHFLPPPIHTHTHNKTKQKQHLFAKQMVSLPKTYLPVLPPPHHHHLSPRTTQMVSLLPRLDALNLQLNHLLALPAPTRPNITGGYAAALLAHAAARDPWVSLFRYEDLVTRPAPSFAAMGRWLGLEGPSLDAFVAAGVAAVEDRSRRLEASFHAAAAVLACGPGGVADSSVAGSGIATSGAKEDVTDDCAQSGSASDGPASSDGSEGASRGGRLDVLAGALANATNWQNGGAALGLAGGDGDVAAAWRACAEHVGERVHMDSLSRRVHAVSLWRRHFLAGNVDYCKAALGMVVESTAYERTSRGWGMT
eukprot:jgi/Mesvir1/22451/Mv17919-RA.1